MLKIFLLLLLLCKTSASAAGWLFWEMGDLVKTPLDEKTIISIKTILPELPLYTDKAKRKENLEIDFIFSAKQGEIADIMTELNWHNLTTNFKKSFFLTVKDLIAGKNSKHFPPAIKYHLNKKLQDLSYGKIIKHQRIEFYVWRLPYRTKNFIPLWAAAYLGKTKSPSLPKNYFTGSKKVKEAATQNNNKEIEENQTTFIKTLKNISTLKITELRHPRRDKNIILIKKIRH